MRAKGRPWSTRVHTITTFCCKRAAISMCPETHQKLETQSRKSHIIIVHFFPQTFMVAKVFLRLIDDENIPLLLVLRAWIVVMTQA